jgi:LAO/AO transport system kinase
VALRAGDGESWVPPVVTTSAHLESGVDALAGAIASHRLHMDQQGRRAARRSGALRERMRLLVEESWRAGVWQSPTLAARFDAIFASVASGAQSPYRAAREFADTLRVEPRASR